MQFIQEICKGSDFNSEFFKLTNPINQEKDFFEIKYFENLSS